MDEIKLTAKMIVDLRELAAKDAAIGAERITIDPRIIVALCDEAIWSPSFQ